MSENRLDRLERAFEAYLEWAADEHGQSRSEFLAGHEELRDLLEPMLAGGAADSAAPDGGESTDRVLGDFRLVREIGRGGMGVVYEAEQVSLQRPVALKLLHPSFGLSARTTSRFKREAEIMGRLDHPGLVKVFAVGRLEDTFYYAMELVDGRSLHDLIEAVRGSDFDRLSGEDLYRVMAPDGSPPPAFWRRGYIQVVVELIRQVAVALEHAHGAGVVHRDVKPANILVRADGTASLTDFGLARQDDLPSLTRAGDFAGTPSYIAPEQAAGRRVDERADVFSLGATLYQVLTHHCPFEAATTHQVLERVRTRDPADPQRLHPRLAPDIAAIVLRALEKDPNQRYQTAGAFAEDLRSFLDYRPVRARRVSTGVRTLRWAKRNPAWACAAALGILLVIGGPLTFGVYSHFAQLATERERVRAEQSLAHAFDAIDQMLTRVADVRLNEVPQAEPVRRALLEDALRLYQKLSAQQAESVELRRRTGRAYYRVANVLDELGRAGEAESAVLQAIRQQEQLCEELPDSSEDRVDLAASLAILANVGRTTGAVSEAMAAAGRAVDLLQPIVETNSDVRCRETLALAFGTLGNSQAEAREYQAAERNLRRALEMGVALRKDSAEDPGAASDLARIHLNLAKVVSEDGRGEESIELNRAALEILRGLAQDHPGWRDNRRKLALACNNLGSDLITHDHIEEAEAVLREAVAAAEKLVADFPGVAGYRALASAASSNLADALLRIGETAPAGVAARRALALSQEAARLHPDVLEYRWREVGYQGEFADHLKGQQQWEKARAALGTAVELARAVVEDFPGDPGSSSRLGAHLNNLALFDFEKGSHLEEATGLLREAIALQRRSLDVDPGNGRSRHFLRNHHGLLSEILLLLGNHEAAAVSADSLGELYPEQPGELRQAAKLLARCVAVARDDHSLDPAARGRTAQSYVDRALALLSEAARIGLADPDSLTRDGDFEAIRAMPEFRALLDQATKGG